MFRVSAFAQLVQEAASASKDDLDRCKRFTGAMDSFGDSIRNLTQYAVYFGRAEDGLMSAVNAASRSLTQLILLHSGGPAGIKSTQEERDKLFDSLWLAMGLEAHSKKAREELSHRLAREFPEDGLGGKKRGYISMLAR